MSAVSMNVTPRSSARWMVAIEESQSVAPYHSLIPMQPRPCADTVSSPSLVVRMCLLAPLKFACWRRGQAAAVVADLRVEQLEALPLSGQRPAHLLAVLFQQLEAFGLARARPDQLGVPLHVPHRHPGGAQLGQQRQPVQVALAEPPPAVPAPRDGPEQADPLVPAQGVLGQATLFRGFADAPGRHETEPTS